jgi:hypothetical protein
MPDVFTHVSLLYLVPLKRLIFGLGFLGIILVIYTLSVLPTFKLPSRKTMLIFTAVYVALFLSISIWAGLSIMHEYPDFVHNKKIMVALAVLIVSSMALIIANRPKVGLLLLSLFTIASVCSIHPLYRGLGPIYNGTLSEEIRRTSRDHETWAAASDIYIENLPQMSDRSAITGVSPYPNIAFWQQYSGKENEVTYNRYAHIVMIQDGSKKPINLVQPDFFTMSSTCTPVLQKTIRHIISSTPLDGTCLQLVKTIPFPARSFYIYNVVKN